ncbi:alpha/beta hydrolase fold protein [Pseudarthrobacter chlorophenolicus A6]|uniref:Alpha/beta hydrolase fold protein n=1 Tax=Pseudarthrobacter chlorophenolicus (strain ATCC 700700 / DSM 12829 / CIP 107037 / JCM 12360 / KCTC 9906 / NCIMB 13794 / A6) TaxID=452863 RepID=B8H8Q6_PSECP|nr:alpha/beta hydrolase [Pseudarthrobacter chlorophenolicus]ACL39934.1 alpha/beta hydrolase fold protein [Pseudarthrobacter chlorophenolicus A6]SDQ91052.1 Lysophospholipase, alpha-beta hydrolase superfamily [Pseudarthrobacter chlorophenolicus]
MTGTAPGNSNAAGRWLPDVLGHGFEKRTLPLAPDNEGAVEATLVRCVLPVAPGVRDAGQPPQAVLYVHGWADYFLQAELAEYLAGSGFAFYAIDLRKFGRSLRPWQTPGYTDNLDVYDEDLSAAIQAIQDDVAQTHRAEAAPAVHLLAHSLGGLVAALWADRNPGLVRTLVLNSPWLELQGSSIIRTIAMHLVDPLSRADPRRPLWLPEMPGYWQSVSSESHGEWHLDPVWRPRASFPIRAGWAKAVLAGHAAVERRLHIQAPVLVMLSERTHIQIEWSADLMEADAVINVEETAGRSLRLGRRVSVFRYPGALHDIFLSRRGVREEACRDLAAWLMAVPF